jgi:hypothetical protein
MSILSSIFRRQNRLPQRGECWVGKGIGSRATIVFVDSVSVTYRLGGEQFTRSRRGFIKNYTPAPSLPSVPEPIAEEIRDTWRAAREANSQHEAFRIFERMTDRLGYGRTENNPPLI